MVERAEGSGGGTATGVPAAAHEARVDLGAALDLLDSAGVERVTIERDGEHPRTAAALVAAESASTWAFAKDGRPTLREAVLALAAAVGAARGGTAPARRGGPEAPDDTVAPHRPTGSSTDALRTALRGAERNAEDARSRADARERELCEARENENRAWSKVQEIARELVRCGRALTFDALRAANRERLPEFRDRQGRVCHVPGPSGVVDGSDWRLSQWGNAVCGELGEAANLIKKIERGDLSLDDARADLGRELADVVTYLDILASVAGIDLGAAVARKFNEVSERVGSSARLYAPPPAPDAARATHRCKVCGARWVRAGEGPAAAWSTASARCGACCDNVPMGAQIEPIATPPAPEATS